MLGKAIAIPKEWYRCVDTGTAAVRRPYQLHQFRKQGFPCLTLYHLPSFQDCTGWTVYRSLRDKECLLQRVTWHRQTDGERFEALMRAQVFRVSAEATLSEASLSLDSTWFEQQLATLASIRIPLHAKRPIGLDGESFGVHARDEFEVEWWCDGPPEWRELTGWAKGCIHHLRQLLPA